MTIAYYSDADCGVPADTPAVFGAINSNFSTVVWPAVPADNVLPSEADSLAVPAWCSDNRYNVWLNSPVSLGTMDTYFSTFSNYPGLIIGAYNDTCVRNLSSEVYGSPLGQSAPGSFSIKPTVTTTTYCVEPHTTQPAVAAASSLESTTGRCHRDQCTEAAWGVFIFIFTTVAILLLAVAVLSIRTTPS